MTQVFLKRTQSTTSHSRERLVPDGVSEAELAAAEGTPGKRRAGWARLLGFAGDRAGGLPPGPSGALGAHHSGTPGTFQSALLLVCLLAVTFTAGTFLNPFVLGVECSQAELPKDFLRTGGKCSAPVPQESVRGLLIQNVFDGLDPFESFPPPHLAGQVMPSRFHSWDSLEGIFVDLIKEVKPRIILEAGSFLGTSAIHMARVAQNLSLTVDVLCVDDFRGWPGFRHKFPYITNVNADVSLLGQFLQNVKSRGVANRIVPLPFNSVSAAKVLCEWGVTADLIYIDGSHDFMSTWNDLTALLPLLRRGGLLFGHGVREGRRARAPHNGVWRAVSLFARLHGLEASVHKRHWVLRPAMGGGGEGGVMVWPGEADGEAGNGEDGEAEDGSQVARGRRGRKGGADAGAPVEEVGAGYGSRKSSRQLAREEKRRLKREGRVKE